MSYQEPCMCGAEDCSRCRPGNEYELEKRQAREDYLEEKADQDREDRKYDGRDKKNEWMDFVPEGPADSRY